MGGRAGRGWNGSGTSVRLQWESSVSLPTSGRAEAMRVINVVIMKQLKFSVPGSVPMCITRGLCVSIMKPSCASLEKEGHESKGP